MPNVSIVATNKYTELTKSRDGWIKMAAMILIGVFFVLGAIFIIKDILTIVITVLAVLMILFWIIQPPRKMKIGQGREGFIVIDSKERPLYDYASWAVVELEDSVEFILRQASGSGSYYYFYTDGDSAADLATYLQNFLPYNPQLAQENPMHYWFRVFGLR